MAVMVVGVLVVLGALKVVLGLLGLLLVRVCDVRLGATEFRE